MKKLFLITLLLFTSCKGEGRYQSISTYTDIQLDHNQCVSNGFNQGTFDYKECRERLDEQRVGRMSQ